MKHFALICVLGVSTLSFSAVAADALSDCYRKADTAPAVQACLKKEFDAVKDHYDDVLDRVMNSARELDRVQRKKVAVKALNDANKAFDAYVENQCDWVEASYGSGSGAGAAALACRVNLYRARAGAMDAQFLTKN
ncbi:MAG: lysozyme inhibitor LprI family protein [Sutterellaceae bacterium]|nr:lysozyme inhibitor LprI family protein [Sutterellaceae bacterium]